MQNRAFWTILVEKFWLKTRGIYRFIKLTLVKSSSIKPIQRLANKH